MEENEFGREFCSYPTDHGAEYYHRHKELNAAFEILQGLKDLQTKRSLLHSVQLDWFRYGDSMCTICRGEYDDWHEGCQCDDWMEWHNTKKHYLISVLAISYNPEEAAIRPAKDLSYTFSHTIHITPDGIHPNNIADLAEIILDSPTKKIETSISISEMQEDYEKFEQIQSLVGSSVCRHTQTNMPLDKPIDEPRERVIDLIRSGSSGGRFRPLVNGTLLNKIGLQAVLRMTKYGPITRAELDTLTPAQRRPLDIALRAKGSDLDFGGGGPASGKKGTKSATRARVQEPQKGNPHMSAKGKGKGPA